MKNRIAVVILAAGKGERMKSALPKVLHPVCRRPMLGYVLELARALKAQATVAVLGYKYEQVREFVGQEARVVIQKKLAGTADAVKQALTALQGFSGTIVVLYGDTPLLQKETLEKLIKRHEGAKAQATILTARIEKPAGYGRILRDQYEAICGIVEEKDADAFQKDIKEINTGIICFDARHLRRAVRQVRPNNRKKEYYLTDVISIFHKEGLCVEGMEIPDINESLGVNSRVELARANKIMQQRINEHIMRQGVTIVDSDTTFIASDAVIGEDTVIYPFTVIENNVKIGSYCKIGPFARLREKTVLKDSVTVGNFLEISRSEVGPHTVAKHFGFIGDSSIGQCANIGAGTVTANYNGKEKNRTSIGDHAFIGSDSVLVAPVRIGRHSRTGAGSVVTKNTSVGDGQTVVGVPARPLSTKKKR